jgi:hypothetical protein
MLKQRGQLAADRARPLLLISGLNTLLTVVAAFASRPGWSRIKSSPMRIVRIPNRGSP